MDMKTIRKLDVWVIFESKSSQKNEVLKELENALVEAKEIKDGKKQGLTLEQIFAI